jgi:acetylornithine deacetylase/succinyl-diaminopimelate desuccinylase-like protein
VTAAPPGSVTLKPMRSLYACVLMAASWPVLAQTPDWSKSAEETLRHYQALVRIDSSDPPGNETQVAEYVKKVLEAESISVTIAAKDPARANLIARLKGNGSKKPLLIMGHSDTVKVDPAKWTFPPFSATRDGGYIYGRGTIDDKSDLTAAMMTMLLLKRSKVPLDRDVIFVSEAGEEAATGVGIEYLVNEHWSDIEAETCIAETGGVRRRNGQAAFAVVETTEKLPRGAKLVAKGPAGHGSRPMRSNAVVHLAGAVQKLALWDPPMRLNDTTRTYFEKLSTVTGPQEAARYQGLLDPQKAPAIREYLAENEPFTYSMLHTSISPNIFQAGYQVNVIPSEATATLDIRALPGEDMDAFYELMRKVIDDPAIEIIPNPANSRPPAQPSRIDSEAFHAIEAAYRKIYNVPTLPFMQTSASDMAFLRAKGVQCYGVGPMVDEDDIAKGFGAHSDQERLLEESLYKHVQFFWEAVTSIASK